jgi:hypothetical protein
MFMLLLACGRAQAGPHEMARAALALATAKCDCPAACDCTGKECACATNQLMASAEEESQSPDDLNLRQLAARLSAVEARLAKMEAAKAAGSALVMASPTVGVTCANGTCSVAPTATYTTTADGTVVETTTSTCATASSGSGGPIRRFFQRLRSRRGGGCGS